jgi:hypothetical protein
MGTYRFYFFDDDTIRGRFDLDNTIRGRFDFPADDDDQAVEIAEILYDACSDRCRSWELWKWTVFLASGPRNRDEARPRASDLAERRQENIVQCEETILHSAWAIASSRRLLAELDNLVASKKGAFRYSQPHGNGTVRPGAPKRAGNGDVNGDVNRLTVGESEKLTRQLSRLSEAGVRAAIGVRPHLAAQAAERQDLAPEVIARLRHFLGGS